ncbi:coniferyl-aldehyde dehydrogenase family protein, partial [Ostertagia ostertagi]
NTVILKLSELSPTFSSVFARLVAKNFDEKLFAAVEGAVPEVTALLAERFDHITYTGNPTVAKVIMTAAAKYLTPVLLELGGKNPVSSTQTQTLTKLQRGLSTSKTYNCGAPHTEANQTEADRCAVTKHFEAMAPFKQNKTFGKIIHERHFDRLSTLLKNTKGKIVYKPKEEPCRAECFLPPHVIEIEKDDVLMQEEIFGPLLPIVTVKSFDEAIEWVRDNEKPLGAYLFTENPDKVKRFLLETSSGGVTVNDVMSHVFVSTLPVGGVGNSGMGRLNGKYGFDNFVHEKPILVRKGLGKEVVARL